LAPTPTAALTTTTAKKIASSQPSPAPPPLPFEPAMAPAARSCSEGLATVVATAVVGASERGVCTVVFVTVAAAGAALGDALLTACPPVVAPPRRLEPVVGVSCVEPPDDPEPTAGDGLGAGAGAGAGGEVCGVGAGAGECTRTVAGDVAGGGGGKVFGGAVVTTGQGTGFQLASTQFPACAPLLMSGMATSAPDAPSSQKPDRFLRSTALCLIGYRRTSALVGFRFHSRCANGPLTMVTGLIRASPNFSVEASERPRHGRRAAANDSIWCPTSGPAGV